MNPDELRFNHYNFELFNLGVARAKNFSTSVEFEVDDGMKRYHEVIGSICKGKKCSENFQLQCPVGFEYINCLDTNKKYPLDMPLNITEDYIDARTKNSKKQRFTPQYRPIPPAQKASISFLSSGIDNILAG